jgi:serine/threonine-protein kinase ATR
MESYRRAYDVIAKLHILQEIENAFKVMSKYSKTDPNAENNLKNSLHVLLKQWDARLKITTPAFRVREPILNLRRIVLQKFR